LDIPVAREGILQFLTEPGWLAVLKDEFQKPYFKGIIKFLQDEKKEGATIFPEESNIFSAFNSTPFDSVRAVIIGQDPYFQPGQAHGLCFSVRKGVKVPPSLNRIYKELERTVPGFKNPGHGCLQDWTAQGILLLNATLTVRQGKPNSHEKCGWQIFTDAVIQILDSKKKGLLFWLWGRFAQKKGEKISKKHHCILSAHPSPMSGSAWINCGCFEKGNKLLAKIGAPPIEWKIAK